MAFLKTCSKFIHDLRDRGSCKFYSIDADQVLKMVIEVDQAKIDPPITDAFFQCAPPLNCSSEN